MVHVKILINIKVYNHVQKYLLIIVQMYHFVHGIITNANHLQNVQIIHLKNLFYLNNVNNWDV